MSSPHTDIGRHGSPEQEARTETVCVVGVGYVGLPLAVAFDRAGREVVGYDVDDEKVTALNRGEERTGHVEESALRDGDVEFTADAAAIADADYVIITVPTPVDDTGNPDLRYVESAARTVGERLDPGMTVVLESTVYPGATRERLVPTLEAASGLREGVDFDVGYSPERLAPGDGGRTLADAVKIVGADDDDVRENLADLYGSVVDAGVHPVSAIEVAEAAKCIENVQRDINIALANELARVADGLDLDTREILEAAGTKWNFHDYRPGLVGGHCIPVDPFYFAHGAERAGSDASLTLQAREVNEAMPDHVADLTLKALNESEKVLNRSDVLLLGLAYKPDVADVRTSAAGEVAAGLEEYGVTVRGHDPHADPASLRDAFDFALDDGPDVNDIDAIVVATGHEVFSTIDLRETAERMGDDPVLVDVPALFDGERARECGFTYRRL